MGNIPIGRTIGEAYDFALGRYLPILGVIWLPLALLVAAEYFVLLPYFLRVFEFVQFALQHAKDHPVPPPEMATMRPYIWSVDALAVVVSVWIQVGIAKTALGVRTGPLFAYVPVDFAELRVIGGYLVFFAILYGAIIAFAIVFGIGVAVVAALVSGGAYDFSHVGGTAPWIFGGVVLCVFAIIAALIYVQVRLLFLLVPATVAEKRFGLWRSWELSRGNFWRIFVVGVGTLSPLLAFEFVLIFAFYILIVLTVVANVMMLKAHGTVHGGPAAVANVLAMLWRYAVVYGAVIAAIVLPLLPIFYGLRFSPSVFAYRSIADKVD
ncbi:MAG TPA: hypothetical protein VKB71_14670 [Rhizomicrobium sp.]|nr:hypothetical protein [Rhizomicrobium sp.]